MKKIFLYLMIFALWNIFGSFSSYAINTSHNDANKQELKVLIVELNPQLATQDNIRASSYLGYENDTQLCVDELIEDLEFGANGALEINIVDKEYLEEFPTYKTQVTLINGEKAHRLDEATWLDIMRNGWYDSLDDSRYQEIGNYNYDYDYLINKLNLVERRNNKEFDQVWLVNVDPASTFESVMVGKTAYWINGEPVYKECANFAIMNVAITRRDINSECFGHMIECVMNTVFRSTTDSGYPLHKVQDKTYEEMSLWEKFTFNSSTYTTDYEFYGTGNMHFPPNGEYDYDWENETFVNSTWEDWKDNYPNLTGKTTAVNYSAWVPEGKEDFAGRYHHRWWFSLFPHKTGVTEDGYSNNWWDYFIDMDFAEKVRPETSYIEIGVGEKIHSLDFEITYKSLKKENRTVEFDSNALKIEDKSIADFENGKLVGKSIGKTTLRYFVDGVYGQIEINVKLPNDIKVPFVKNYFLLLNELYTK